jgi:hypothetical protein
MKSDVKRKLGGQDWDGEEILSRFSGGAKREKQDISKRKQCLNRSENTCGSCSRNEIRNEFTKIYGRRTASGFWLREVLEA